MTLFVMGFDVTIQGVLVEADSAFEAMEKAPNAVISRIFSAIDADGVGAEVSGIDVHREELVGDEDILEVD